MNRATHDPAKCVTCRGVRRPDSSGGHDHRGPGPCPKCGGTPPEQADRTDPRCPVCQQPGHTAIFHRSNPNPGDQP